MNLEMAFLEPFGKGEGEKEWMGNLEAGRMWGDNREEVSDLNVMLET